MLVHSGPIILVCEAPKQLFPAIRMQHTEVGVSDAIEDIGLDRRVMYHILEDDLVAHRKRLRETPGAHIVTAETTVAAQSIDILVGQSILHGIGRQCFGATHLGLIGHLETVWHVTSEGDVQDGSADAMVLDDVHHLGHQGTSLPGKGTAGFQDDLKIRITLTQAA